MTDKSRRKKEPKHVRLYVSIMQTEAWRSLSGNAVKVLLALVARDNGTRNGELSFSVREAADVANLSPATAKRCLDELQDRGFIRCTQKGAFSRKVQHASTWRYTWQAWPEGKMGPTRDFEKWKPGGNTRCQKLQKPVLVSDAKLETTCAPVAKSIAADGGNSLISANRGNSKTSTHTIKPQGAENSEPTLGLQRKAIDDLRTALKHRLAASPAGEQTRIAETLGVPGGTLSKFVNGRGLPDQYVEPLRGHLKTRVRLVA